LLIQCFLLRSAAADLFLQRENLPASSGAASAEAATAKAAKTATSAASATAKAAAAPHPAAHEPQTPNSKKAPTAQDAEKIECDNDEDEDNLQGSYPGRMAPRRLLLQRRHFVQRYLGIGGETALS
jgi:hypothetical protein